MEHKNFEEILELEIACKPNLERLKIFGKKFVENNKDKCKIIYNDKEKELKEYYEEFNNMNVIKFKLKFIKKIIDMSYMFEMCDNLISIKIKGDTNGINIELIITKIIIV